MHLLNFQYSGDDASAALPPPHIEHTLLGEPCQLLQQPKQHLQQPVQRSKQPVQHLQQPEQKLKQPEQQLQQPLQQSRQPVQQSKQPVQHLLSQRQVQLWLLFPLVTQKNSNPRL